MNAKLILETQVSIDGFMADQGKGTAWMIWSWGGEWNWDEKLQTYHTQLIKSSNALIISSQMAQEGFINHWRSVSNPDNRQYNFASHIMNSLKFVASKKLTEQSNIPGGWENTQILTGDLKEAVNNLKNEREGNILVFGGATLVSYLIDADLIDEYYLVMNPVALGAGLPIFKNRKNLKPVESTLFECGIIVNHFRR